MIATAIISSIKVKPLFRANLGILAISRSSTLRGYDIYLLKTPAPSVPVAITVIYLIRVKPLLLESPQSIPVRSICRPETESIFMPTPIGLRTGLTSGKVEITSFLSFTRGGITGDR